MIKKFLYLILFIPILLFSSCQKSFVPTKTSYCHYPRWVKTIDRPDANYYKACKQFDKYWRRHFPVTEDEEEYSSGNKEKKEVEEENDPRPFFVKIFQSEEKAKRRSNALNVEKKRFEKWRLESLPYVKEDGYLMTSEERIKAWRQLNNMQ